MANEYILEMKDITKVYPNGVIANKNVDLSLKYNEIHAILGENGAGKSTLMKTLFGSEQATEGKIYLHGEEVVFNDSLHAIQNGIGMVHQHFMLDSELTVTENIILGMEPTKGLSLDYKKARELVADAAKKYNFNVRPDQKVSDLSVGQKQKVEILKALTRGAKILILDEPTAVLTPQETDELFVQLKQLRDDGHTIVFISHKLNEVKEICTRGTVLRSGVGMGSYDLSNITIEELSRLMVGRDVVREVEKTKAVPQEVALKIEHLTVLDDELNVAVNDVSFNVRKGQIIGIAGVEGNGQRELIDSITGLDETYEGNIYLNGTELLRKNGIKQRRHLNMKHIPEDRNTLGVMPDASIKENLIALNYDKDSFNKKILMDTSVIEKFSNNLIEKYQVKTDSADTAVRMLSGGNVQKVVAAREMEGDVDLLVADQPTRGIDIGAASFIHDQLIEMRKEGAAIILVSADINEVLTVSDSILVFYDGEITACFDDASNCDEEILGRYMLGLKRMSKEELTGVNQ